MKETIPLGPLVREILIASGGVTALEIHRFLLGAGVMLEASELSSWLARAVTKERVRRQPWQRPESGMGRRIVWRYTWAG